MFFSIPLALALLMGGYTGGIAAEKVKLALDWVINARHAPYYVALEKGWWKEKGLDVDIARGFGSVDTAKRVVAGTDGFGFADAGTVVVARANGAKLKMLGVFYSKAPYVTVSWKESGIKTPKDLEGKTIGSPVADSNRIVFPALAKMNGVDPAKVKWMNMSPEAKTPALLARKVDAILQYAFEKRLFDDMTRQGKGNFETWFFADFGLEMYSAGLITSDAILSGKPQVVRALTEGVARGYAFAVSHKEEAVEIFFSKQPLLDKQQMIPELKILEELLMTPEAVANGVGWMTEEKIKRTRDVMCGAVKCETIPELNALYTNDFLPRKK